MPLFAGDLLVRWFCGLPHETECAILRGRLHKMPGSTVTVDLATQEVTEPDGAVYRFKFAPFRKESLLNGEGDVALTHGHIELFESSGQKAEQEILGRYPEWRRKDGKSDIPAFKRPSIGVAQRAKPGQLTTPVSRSARQARCSLTLTHLSNEKAVDEFLVQLQVTIIASS